MLTYLREGRANDSGWLRKEEAVANNEVVKEGKSRVHLNERENDLPVKIRACIESLVTATKPSHHFSPTKDLSYAFGVSVSLVKQCVAHHIINNGSNK